MAAAAILCVLCLAGVPAGARQTAGDGLTATGGAAPGGPGAVGFWDTGRKMGVGTAIGRRSRVWFTITDGILSEVYYPTLDTPDVGTLQYVVTDGRGWTQRESADTRHAIRLLDSHALAYEVANTARDGSYRIVTDYSADPARSVLLLHSRFEALRPGAAGDRVYVLFRPNVNGTSLHNTAMVDRSSGRTVVIASNPDGAYGPVTAALAAQPDLGDASVGFRLSASDCWLDLRTAHRLTHHYTIARDGTVVAAAAVALRPGHEATLALSFAPGATAAVTSAQAALALPYSRRLAAYVAGWRAYAAALHAPSGLGGDLLQQFYVSALVLKAAEDKTYTGAIVASPTIPWGNAKAAGAGRIGGYHLVWARDLYEVASALLAVGDRATAREALGYLFTRQQGTDGGMPQNTWLNGDVSASAVQLDQVAYPVVLAWQLGVTDATRYRKHIAPAANYLIRVGPSTEQERWEEVAGYSPSTIAAEIAALVCAADIAARNGDPTGALLFRGVADDWARHVADWTATHSGHLSRAPYYFRIDDNTNPDDGDVLGIANGGGAYDERDVVDAGFLELVRLGIVPATDPLIENSLAVVDRQIRVQTRNGPGWYRYSHDGYGETADGSPFNGSGQGRLWPIFTGERGEYDLLLGQRAQAMAMLAAMRAFAYGAGMIPEQVWDRPDLPPAPAAAADDEWSGAGAGSIGFRNGEATGSACPLDWSMAQYVRLAAGLGAGRVLEQPAVVADRYRRPQPAGPALTLTSPPASRHHFASPLLVRGHVAPGSRLLVALYTLNGRQLYTPTVSGSGDFSLSLRLPPLESKLIVLATDSQGRSSVAERTVTLKVA